MIDHQLIQDCKQGKRDAMKRLYELTLPVMHGVCLRYAADKYEAEDFTQEGYLKVFSQIESFRYQGSFEGWMRKVIVNNCLQLIKQKNRIHFEILAPDKDGAYEEYNDEENYAIGKKLIVMMQQLPDGYRTILNLFIIEEFSHHEIAKALNISVNTSKSQLHRAKEKLRKLIEAELKADRL